jgi:hypothetical protein
MMGGAKVLPREEVVKLFDARSRYNISSKARMEPGMPLVAEDFIAQPNETSKKH